MRRCIITIDDSGFHVDLNGNAKGDITYLTINSFVKSELHFLNEYPNLNAISLTGKFSSLQPLSQLTGIETVFLNVSNQLDISPLYDWRIKNLEICFALGMTVDKIEPLLTEYIECLQLGYTRKITDLSFVTKAVNLQRLRLYELPCVTQLPELYKLPRLYALKVEYMHKVRNIDGLINLSIKYMNLTLFADKLSGTKISKIIQEMKFLKQLNINLIDRNSSIRYDVISNQLHKNGHIDVLNDTMNFDRWMELLM